jgi:IS30 family transposase
LESIYQALVSRGRCLWLDAYNKITAQLNKKTKILINRCPAEFKTITADNGTEFHQYSKIEEASSVKFYFANPYHFWERGGNENVNGLIRQYLPRGTSMNKVTQAQCNSIAKKLNERPRKRHNYKTPEELFYA